MFHVVACVSFMVHSTTVCKELSLNCDCTSARLLLSSASFDDAAMLDHRHTISSDQNASL